MEKLYFRKAKRKRNLRLFIATRLLLTVLERDYDERVQAQIGPQMGSPNEDLRHVRIASSVQFGMNELSLKG